MAKEESVKDEVKNLLNEARHEAQNFDINAILRGAQLTVVGALRALHNPDLFMADIYKQAALAVAVGVIIRVLIEAPVLITKILIWIVSFTVDLEHAKWDDAILDSLDFITNVVLQVPFFLMNLRQLIPIGPSLDDMFMMSLKWIDQTYVVKHKSEDPTHLRSMYWPTLSQYSTHSTAKTRKDGIDTVLHLVSRFGKKAALSLGIYLLSFLPVVGQFVLPAASFYTFRKSVGPVPAAAIFGVGVFLPRRYLATFLQSYFASRSLTRKLLQPYLRRVQFTKEQQKQFFKDREGVLFGFGVGFYLFLKTPLLGVLIYGIAEASTAYLITKITDPPPPPEQRDSYAASQVCWTNKKDFLRLPFGQLDASNIESDEKGVDPLRSGRAPIVKHFS